MPEVEKMIIVKLDSKGRLWLPKEIRTKYPPGQKFTVEANDGTLTLRPIKKITVELDDGTTVEVEP